MVQLPVVTTILAIQGDNYAVVCSDSRISDVDSNGYISQIGVLKDGNSKVSTSGKYLIGVAGDLRAINILHHVFNPPVPPASLKGKKLDEFMTVKFIPALRECFDQQGYSIPDKEDKQHLAEHASSILVSIHSTIYLIEGDYSWYSDTSGIYAMGTGAHYVLGAAQALFPKKKITAPNAKAIALKCLNIAAKYDPYTGSPFHAFIQETK